MATICKAQGVPEEHLLLVAVDLMRPTMILINPEMDLLWRVVGNGKLPIVYRLDSPMTNKEAGLPASLLPVFHLSAEKGRKRVCFPLLVRKEKVWEDLPRLLFRSSRSGEAVNGLWHSSLLPCPAPAAFTQIHVAADVCSNGESSLVRLRWGEALPRGTVSLCLGWPDKLLTLCAPLRCVRSLS